jgi:MFS family permease
VLAAVSVFLVFPAIGVASEEIGSLDGLSALRVVVVVFVSVLVFATIVVVPIVAGYLADRWSDRPRRAVRDLELA